MRRASYVQIKERAGEGRWLTSSHIAIITVNRSFNSYNICSWSPSKKILLHFLLPEWLLQFTDRICNRVVIKVQNKIYKPTTQHWIDSSSFYALCKSLLHGGQRICSRSNPQLPWLMYNFLMLRDYLDLQNVNYPPSSAQAPEECF